MIWLNTLVGKTQHSWKPFWNGSANERRGSPYEDHFSSDGRFRWQVTAHSGSAHSCWWQLTVALLPQTMAEMRATEVWGSGLEDNADKLNIDYSLFKDHFPQRWETLFSFRKIISSPSVQSPGKTKLGPQKRLLFRHSDLVSVEVYLLLLPLEGVWSGTKTQRTPFWWFLLSPSWWRKESVCRKVRCKTCSRWKLSSHDTGIAQHGNPP